MLRTNFGRGFSTAGRFCSLRGRSRRAGARRVRDVGRHAAAPRRRSTTGRRPTRNSLFLRSTSARSIRNIFGRSCDYDSLEAPGTIVIDPGKYYLYRIEGEGKATRYGANVSRPEFLWSGEAYVGRKAEWPVWTPPKAMFQRQPEAGKSAGGMPGGLDNPLGARTLNLYQDGKYTLYTIYSTSDPEIDRDRRVKRLHRPPQPGHARPLSANARQDEGGHAAGIGDGVSFGPGARLQRRRMPTQSGCRSRSRRVGRNMWRSGIRPRGEGRISPVMAGLDPAIHAVVPRSRRRHCAAFNRRGRGMPVGRQARQYGDGGAAWMAGSSRAMTV